MPFGFYRNPDDSPRRDGRTVRLGTLNRGRSAGTLISPLLAGRRVRAKERIGRLAGAVP